ncbi:hypothetical protein Val02_63360 [Virgisporangium aliadipatigenens]|uniref:BlaI/MecI/CopY family transcriptional regulator n=1 Tax=Virgisporangium aliadipatigenens TaxID=741659 RepID=A0A8J4DSP2_9ACTN|nr:hypothetical protein Val02_63360 [Virgisporangium aliadipatigenens]
MRGLGDLERAVMEAVWAAPGPVRVRDVVDRLDDRGPAYTTVLTVLDRLAGKGLVSRERDGKAWSYRAVHDREEYIARLMLDALALAGSRDAALVHFADSVSPDEAATLRAALREKS